MVDYMMDTEQLLQEHSKTAEILHRCEDAASVTSNATLKANNQEDARLLRAKLIALAHELNRRLS